MVVETTCFLSAALFFASNAIGFSLFNIIRHERGFTWKDYLNLNPDMIKAEFDYDNNEYLWEVMSGLLSSMAWMIFCIPVIQVAWIQSNGGKFLLGTHLGIAVLVLGASFIEIVSRLLFIGSTMSANGIADHFNLSNWIDISGDDAQAAEEGTATVSEGDLIGWRVLQMISMITRGMVRWIDSVEWMFLAAILYLIYVSVYKSENTYFSRNWARFGMLLALVSLMNFTFDILHLRAFMTQAWMVVVLTAISRFILMPAWLIWLGQELPAARSSALVANGKDADANDEVDTEAPAFT